jgi:hypothetical protein
MEPYPPLVLTVLSAYRSLYQCALPTTLAGLIECIECNTKHGVHGVTYTNRKCQRCGTGVDNETHLLFECSHVALVVLVASRSKHMALFDGVSGVSSVREWMVAAYKPELAATLGSYMQDMMHGLKTGLDGQPDVTPAS